MKKLLVLLPLVFCLLQACSSSKKTAKAAPPNGAAASAAADGSTYEKAIVISASSEGSGVAAEYAWLRKTYPGYKLISQSLSNKDKKAYDLMAIQTSDGDKKTVYFDITNFFGKW